MLLREGHGVPPGWDVRLLASDLSNPILEKARTWRQRVEASLATK